MNQFLYFLQQNFLIITGLGAFIKWVWEYSQKQKFERNKLLLDRMEKFHSLEEVKIAQKLLDWNSTSFLYEGEEYQVDDKILIDALKTQDIKHEFDPTEVVIRKIFDTYFDQLNELLILRDCGLIDENNLERFLKYWILILNGEKNNKSKCMIQTIRIYLNYYGYTDLRDYIFD